MAAYAAVGLFDGKAPDISTMVDPSIVAGIYDTSETLIWPG